jgi:phosphate transport system substrate-binding protein
MKYLFWLNAAMILLNIFSCPVQADQVILISGATTVQPVIEKIIDQYTELTGQRVDIQGGGSLTGVKNAINKTSHLGMVSRTLSAEEKQSLKHVTLGMDALVFIVNERNPLNEIDLDTMISLFTGQIFNWNELTEWDKEVVLVSKEMGRSTLELFEQYSGVHHRDNPSPGQNGRVSDQAYEIGSNFDGITLVGGVPGAVGYMSLGTTNYLKGKGMPVKILSLNGFILDNESIRKGEYPITRELNLVYLEENQELVREFIEYCLSPRGQEVIFEFKYLPIN